MLLHEWFAFGGFRCDHEARDATWAFRDLADERPLAALLGAA